MDKRFIYEYAKEKAQRRILREIDHAYLKPIWEDINDLERQQEEVKLASRQRRIEDLKYQNSLILAFAAGLIYITGADVRKEISMGGYKCPLPFEEKVYMGMVEEEPESEPTYHEGYIKGLNDAVKVLLSMLDSTRRPKLMEVANGERDNQR